MHVVDVAHQYTGLERKVHSRRHKDIVNGFTKTFIYDKKRRGPWIQPLDTPLLIYPSADHLDALELTIEFPIDEI
jgi:hypothetical protein